MIIRRLLLAFPVAALVGCYASEFVATSPYAGAPRSKEQIQVFTTQPAAGMYREVGIVTAQGASFNGALERGKEQAAQHGCDALVVQGQEIESGRGVPGSAYGMSRYDLRCSCLARVVGAAASSTAD